MLAELLVIILVPSAPCRPLEWSLPTKFGFAFYFTQCLLWRELEPGRKGFLGHKWACIPNSWTVVDPSPDIGVWERVFSSSASGGIEIVSQHTSSVWNHGPWAPVIPSMCEITERKPPTFRALALFSYLCWYLQWEWLFSQASFSTI